MAAPDTDERALARRCADGDAEAWEAFHRAYAPAVRQAVLAAFLRRRGSAQPDDVENLVQKVFLHLLEDRGRRLRSFAGRSRLATWLSVVAARLVLNALTGEAGRAARETAAGDWIEAVRKEGAPDSPVRQALREEDRLAIHRILRRLPPRDQVLLRMIHEEGLSYAETARAIGVNPHSIAPLLQRARARFRAAAAEHHPDLLS